jgi:hypothetical protein
VPRRRRRPRQPLARFDDSLLVAAATLAQEGGVVTTAHLLVAAIEGSEPLAAWWASAPGTAPAREAAGLRSGAGESDAATAAGRRLGVSYDYLASQAVGAAAQWAAGREETAGPAHLVVVLLDQASAPVGEVLAHGAVDAGALREAALGLLGIPADHPAVPFDPLPPAGTARRPALAVSALPETAWTECRRRQAALPLRQLHRRSDWYAISLNEQRAVLRLADRLDLDDDHRYSLLHHHLEAARLQAATAAPGAVDPPRPPGTPARPIVRLVSARRSRRRLLAAGWRCWFANRRVSWRARWFRLAGQQ